MVERLLVEKADRTEAEFRMLQQTICDEVTDLAGPDDERRFRMISLSTILEPKPFEGDAPCSEVQRRERPHT